VSVLKGPRLYFTGVISWDPGVLNNSDEIYDATNVRIDLPSGVTYDSFKEYAISNQLGSWNYYGTHTCQFLSEKTRISGGVTEPGGPLVSNDPVVGKSVGLFGKLVDLDPTVVHTSQIYFNSWSVGDSAAGLRAQRHHRMHSRWLNFVRNLGRLPIAGVAAVVFQTAVPAGQTTITNTAGSRLLAALDAAMHQPGAAGLMLRFATYRTLYFRNGIDNTLPEQPRNLDQLYALYQQGKIFSNPAYSIVTGSIGVWHEGELASMPGGRLLVPTAMVAPTGQTGAGVPLGPLVAEVDEARRLISLDLLATIPESDATLEKTNFGALSLAVETPAGRTVLAAISPAQYGRSAYESSGGIIDLALTVQPDPTLVAALRTGRLMVVVEQGNQQVTALAEATLTAQADDRDNYLNQGEVRDVAIQVRSRGETPLVGTRVLAAFYDRALHALPIMSMVPQLLPVDAAGTAQLRLAAGAPGFLTVGLFPLAPNDPVPTPPGSLDTMSGFFVSARVLPFDDDLAARSADSQLTWQFIYETVLRTYALLNPVMASPDIGLPLDNEQAVTAAAGQIKAVIDAGQFESVNYMPITRELSAGKRRLLQRWCDLVLTEAAPAGGSAPAASVEEQPRERTDPRVLRS
jgi:hypothetical protein